ncbi:hypothetical protein CVT26_005526 [Gymnopilus dilepis]|uniref:SCP domain-containing protein n=1 Tax=Gymnopilus dilepis TaxID=231916 RepID=A0A409W820_9AGAR|nr:hypothetical protein CVT26_005526 [Gymnopilus dilepis]
MKFSICLSLIPLLASFCVSTVMAYSVYNTQRAELAARQDLESALISYLERRTQSEERKPSLLKAIFSRPKLTEEEKERKKAFRAAHKEYVKSGKEIHKEAKKEGRTGVQAVFNGPGYAEHGEKALKAAHHGWKNNNHLQQFTHADVTASRLKSGRTHVSVRYHKNDGAPGAHESYILD